jgi:hypothetical protein
MTSWKSLSEKVNAKGIDDPKWKSHANQLSMIFTKAELWGLDPTKAENITMSNLSEIVSEARKAIVKARPDRLEELFSWAADLTNKELRIKLRGDERGEISVKRIERDVEPFYLLEVTEEQFARITRAMEEYFVFKYEEDEM